MGFIESAVLFIGCWAAGLFFWIRYQSTDEVRWLAGLAFVVIAGVVLNGFVSDGIGDCVRYSSRADDMCY